ncbi:hypothetical protein DRZ78_02385 [Candidatus Aerophobetes bacterium]|uniref:HTH merR-type domain-containing protein n=1 Tax=Aerophobetes bacterium TaxID=2030807 RepID=A0A662D5B1_UNCAE|nr:MAG: hypothetical protein DRZ78_02385 [Candidatus Aerophobetes bacterium]
MSVYLIGDLARKTGLSRHTINYYINIGLIQEVGRSENNYRFFDDKVVERLNKIIDLRSKNVSIKRIKEILEKDGG